MQQNQEVYMYRKHKQKNEVRYHKAPKICIPQIFIPTLLVLSLCTVSINVFTWLSHFQGQPPKRELEGKVVVATTFPMAASVVSSVVLPSSRLPGTPTCVTELITFAWWHNHAFKKSFPILDLELLKKRPWFSQVFSVLHKTMFWLIFKSKQSKTTLSHQDKIKLCLILFEEPGMKYYIFSDNENRISLRNQLMNFLWLLKPKDQALNNNTFTWWHYPSVFY